MYTTIKISAQVIRIGAANSSTFTNAWTNDPVEMITSNLGEYVRDAIAEKLNPL